MQKGYTLIEMLVVISILSTLVSLIIVFSQTSQRQLNLFKEQSRLVSSVLRAKSLSLQTFLAGDTVCGYGVHVDISANKYYVFFDPKISNSCVANDRQYSGPAEIVTT